MTVIPELKDQRKDEWIGKHFRRSEISCKCGCGKSDVSPLLVDMLDKLRDMSGLPVVVTSVCRCAKHNATVMGESDSSHVFGLAADIRIRSNHERYLFIKIALTLGFSRVGISNNFIHLDIDQNKPQQVIWIY